MKRSVKNSASVKPKVFSRITRAHGADTAKKLARFLILTGLGFVFVYPQLYMISVSFRTPKTLWIPP